MGDERDSIRERVNRYAPYPAHEPSHAGFTGAAIIGFAAIPFLAIAGLSMHGRVALAVYVAIVIGFLGPYLYFSVQARRHFAEMARLEAEESRRNSAPE